MLWIIDRITVVRVEDEHEELGLDEAIHGETAYVEVDVAVVRSTGTAVIKDIDRGQLRES